MKIKEAPLEFIIVIMAGMIITLGGLLTFKCSELRSERRENRASDAQYLRAIQNIQSNRVAGNMPRSTTNLARNK